MSDNSTALAVTDDADKSVGKAITIAMTHACREEIW
jgi:hypothetical protein